MGMCKCVMSRKKTKREVHDMCSIGVFALEIFALPEKVGGGGVFSGLEKDMVLSITLLR